MADQENHPHGGMKPMYVVWIALLFLTIIEVLLAYLQVPLMLMLISLLGLSTIKAALIVAYFMHMKFERMSLVLTIVPAFIACMLLLNVFFPDAMRMKRIGVNRELAAPAGEARHP